MRFKYRKASLEEALIDDDDVAVDMTVSLLLITDSERERSRVKRPKL
jgi:hypothetical protein